MTYAYNYFNNIWGLFFEDIETELEEGKIQTGSAKYVGNLVIEFKTPNIQIEPF